MISDHLSSPPCFLIVTIFVRGFFDNHRIIGTLRRLILVATGGRPNFFHRGASCLRFMEVFQSIRWRHLLYNPGYFPHLEGRELFITMNRGSDGGGRSTERREWAWKRCRKDPPLCPSWVSIAPPISLSASHDDVITRGQVVRFLGTSRYELPWATLFGCKQRTHSVLDLASFTARSAWITLVSPPWSPPSVPASYWLSIPTTTPPFRNLQGTVLLPEIAGASSR
jgi:hypothetical protein